ncbi:unnamed protein product [Ceratitis capitata]|uniref:(Mediterranean fruit fly) hypothetical protein n=1 Tax=Ceratitis capitata TaxID=7213 RepID=A0A811U0N1_CERCA|nr:unnamed protein product [Ceratitis capitata]
MALAEHLPQNYVLFYRKRKSEKDKWFANSRSAKGKNVEMLLMTAFSLDTCVGHVCMLHAIHVDLRARIKCIVKVKKTRLYYVIETSTALSENSSRTVER